MDGASRPRSTGPGRGRLRRLRGPDDEGDQRGARPPVVAVADGTVPGRHPGRDAGAGGRSGSTGCWTGCAPLLADGDVALVAHGHVLRILTARWLRLAPEDGALFPLRDRPLRRARVRARAAGAHRLEHRLPTEAASRAAATGCQRPSGSSTGGSRADRPAEQPALTEVGAQRGHLVGQPLGLDALGHDDGAELVGEVGDRLRAPCARRRPGAPAPAPCPA